MPDSPATARHDVVGRAERPACARFDMKYWLDTEFIERPYTIDLISVGLVAEDGREFYAESNEVDWTKARLWTLQTVRPQLQGPAMPRIEIGYAVRSFVEHDEQPVFWG